MNGFDLSTISGIFVGSTEYSAIYKGSSLIWQSGPHDYSQDYLTFESLEDNNVIGWKKSSSDAPTGTIQYSTDKTTWTSVTPDTTGVTLATLNTGDKLYLKGDNDAYGNFPSNTNRWINFTSTKTFNMYGNIMSLLNSTNFRTMTTLPAVTRTFSNIFLATKVVDASNLILPATAVTFVGYYCMFKNCTELTTPPVLPATSLNMYCYNSMFEGCSKLATLPVLLATSLANYCYQSMFKGCTSLTSIPSNYLPATNISNYAYYGMFEGCTNLTTVPNNLLPATTLAYQCYCHMFYGCTSLTSVPSLPATTLISGCYYLMFYNCTSLTAAPELPATTLAQNCYREMFENCTSLNSAPELPATTLAQNCYRGMFQNCSNITTAPELPATTLVDACYRSMFYGCSKLNYIKMLATDISATECLYYWTNGVAVSGTFVKHPNATISTSTSGIPSGWTVKLHNIYFDEYFTIESTANNNYVFFDNTNGATSKSIEYSKDKVNWTSVTSSYNGNPFTSFNNGEKIYFRHTGTWNVNSSRTYSFDCTMNFKISGNIMSLLYGDDFKNHFEVSEYSFCLMFQNKHRLIDISNLVLPATTLAAYCYQGMFMSCGNITTAPTLPATTLAAYCYNAMFSSCTSLSYVKMLATDISATSCLSYWLMRVSSTGTFVRHTNMTTLPTGSSGIPSGWTVQTATS